MYYSRVEILERRLAARRKRIRIRNTFFAVLGVITSALVISLFFFTKEPTSVLAAIEPEALRSEEFINQGMVAVETELVNVEEIEIPNFNYDEYTATEEEVWWYEHITMAEVYSFWDEEEMLYIASAIRNRIESAEYPNDVISVLTQRFQFSTYGDKRYLEVEPNDTCSAAVKRALLGDTNIPSDIVFFCTTEYYEAEDANGFFHTLVNVPEYSFRNIMMFKAE